MNQIVANQINTAYYESYSSWSLEECLEVFHEFYEEYRHQIKHEHPHMRTQTIRSIIEMLDTVTDAYGREFTLEPELYPEIIQAYFGTPFADCNYSMAHFMSGDIRINRCWELGIL